eukprot:s144_g8.t1
MRSISNQLSRLATSATSGDYPGPVRTEEVEEQIAKLIRQNADDPARVRKGLTSLRRKAFFAHPQDARTAIRSLGEASFWEEALALLRVKWHAPFLPTGRLFSEAIGILPPEQWPLALAILKEAKENASTWDVEVLNTAMHLCSTAGHRDVALALFHSLHGLALLPNVCTFNTAMNTYFADGRWDEALRLLEDMWDGLLMPDIVSYNTAICACSDARRGGWERALSLLREAWVEGLPCSMITYAGVIQTCTRSMQWQRALQLLKDARVATLPPDVPTHTAAIAACGQASAWEQSLVLLTDMAGHKTWPDTTTFNEVISSCGKGLQWRRALGLLMHMEMDEVDCNAVTYRALVDAYKRASLWERVLSALEEIESFSGGLDWQTALLLLEDLVFEGLADSYAHSAGVAACARARRWHQALLLLQQSQTLSLANDQGFNAAMSSCRRPGQWPIAVHLLSAMPAHRAARDVFSFTAACSSCQSGQQWQRILQNLQDADRDGVEIDVGLVDVALFAQLQNGAWLQALRTLCRPEKPWHLSGDTYAEALAQAEDAADTARGLPWLKKAQGSLSLCLQQESSMSSRAQLQSVILADLLQAHGHLKDGDRQVLRRRFLDVLLWRLAALQDPAPLEEQRRRIPRAADFLRYGREWAKPERGKRHGWAIREEGRRLQRISRAAHWKRVFVRESTATSSRASLPGLHELFPSRVFNLGADSHDALSQVGISSSSRWHLRAQRLARGQLTAAGAMSPRRPVGKELPAVLSVSLGTNPRSTIQLIGWGLRDRDAFEEELPGLSSRATAAHCERNALHMALKQLKMSTQITPLQPSMTNVEWDSADQLGGEIQPDTQRSSSWDVGAAWAPADLVNGSKNPSLELEENLGGQRSEELPRREPSKSAEQGTEAAEHEDGQPADSGEGFQSLSPSRFIRDEYLERIQFFCDQAQEGAMEALSVALKVNPGDDARKWLKVAEDALRPASRRKGKTAIESRALRQRAGQAASALLAVQNALSASPNQAIEAAERALGDLFIWRCQRRSPLRSRSGFKNAVQEALSGRRLTSKHWARFFYIHKQVVVRQLPEIDFKVADGKTISSSARSWAILGRKLLTAIFHAFKPRNLSDDLGISEATPGCMPARLELQQWMACHVDAFSKIAAQLQAVQLEVSKCLAMAAVAFVARGEDLEERALHQDDQCTGEQCALNALQHRGAKIATEAAEAEELQAEDEVEDMMDTEEDLGVNYTELMEYGCFAKPSNMRLSWRASGRDFFQQFTFVTQDDTHGAHKYLNFHDAVRHGVIGATNHGSVFMKIGGIEPTGEWIAPYKRHSVMIHSNYAWHPQDGFLVVMKYNHVPWGPSIWPAFWLMNSDKVWPDGGEFDIMEFANDEASKITFHTDKNCLLDPRKVGSCMRGKRMGGSGPMNCNTNYWKNLFGCRAFAASWDEDGITVYHIPNHEIPADLKEDKPRPESWGKWVVAYLPYVSHTCHKDLAGPQEIVLNIALCGDWAGNAWFRSGSARSTGFTHGCRADIGKPYEDCCTKYATSHDGRIEHMFRNQAYFDIDYMKVYTSSGARSPSLSGIHRRGGWARMKTPVVPARAWAAGADDRRSKTKGVLRKWLFAWWAVLGPAVAEDLDAACMLQAQRSSTGVELSPQQLLQEKEDLARFDRLAQQLEENYDHLEENTVAAKAITDEFNKIASEDTEETQLFCEYGTTTLDFKTFSHGDSALHVGPLMILNNREGGATNDGDLKTCTNCALLVYSEDGDQTTVDDCAERPGPKFIFEWDTVKDIKNILLWDQDDGSGDTKIQLFNENDELIAEKDVDQKSGLNGKGTTVDLRVRGVKMLKLKVLMAGSGAIVQIKQCGVDGSEYGDPHILTLDGDKFDLYENGALGGDKPKTGLIDWQMFARYGGPTWTAQGLLLVDRSNDGFRQAMELTAKDCQWRRKTNAKRNWSNVGKNSSVSLLEGGDYLSGFEFHSEKHLSLRMNTPEGLVDSINLHTACKPKGINVRVSMPNIAESRFLKGQIQVGNGRGNNKFAVDKKWTALGGSEYANSFFQGLAGQQYSLLTSCTASERAKAQQICVKHLGEKMKNAKGTKGEIFNDCVFDVCRGGEEFAIAAAEMLSKR